MFPTSQPKTTCRDARDRLRGKAEQSADVLSLNSTDGKPDLSTLKVFVSSPAQGVCYHAGIWRKFDRAQLGILDSGLTKLTAIPAFRRSLGRLLHPFGSCRYRHSDHHRRKPAHRPRDRAQGRGGG